MALSLLNYFFWNLEDARLPFMLADGVVILGLHFLDRALKAEKKLRQLEEEKKAEIHEEDKREHNAVKLQNREETIRERKHEKAKTKRI